MMKKLTKKQNIFLILLFSLLSFLNGRTQTVEETIRFADQEYHLGNYSSAAKEYQRAYFFGDKTQVSFLNFKIGDSFFAMQDYEKAKSFYRQANQFAKKDSLKVEAFFKEVSCDILENNFLLALMRLKSFHKSMTSEQKHLKSFLTAMCYYGAENFEKAEEEFLLSLDSSKIDQRTEIASIFDKKRNYMSPNPKVAWWLSLFIPGSGQIYAGDIKNGLNSFFLTASLFYLGARISLYYSYIDAIVGVAPWVQRYYSGGYTHAEDIAIKKRNENRDKTFEQIYHLIVEKAPTIKDNKN